ncbi:sacsin N-terminal ATP-binding-like domain-containing protein [Butyrivibrio fibrisolvens]|uniref:sacsin N-terminal ATP-binding-like domain-containing protein n=1 Tax=Butyrivibrio fibrisolvens TaxID=831 RepID=UPI0003B60ED0|nr:hypothetical protein [Butyrivibrio fibrisolvens]
MANINYKAIYEANKADWKALTDNPQKYEALLAGHYSDSNHFVYELLQNAEDEKASKVVIEYYDDKLVFYHNGDPFDEADVKGVSSMLMGTKDREDAQTIGRFGMGFKSVFKYTYQPEIYSDDEAFKITSYLLPEENASGWDYAAEKEEIKCKLSDGKALFPFKSENHLTKIVIPFLKYGKSGELETVPGHDVLEKLDELNGEILLFLSRIKDLYWTNKETGHFAHISLSIDESDENLITCRIEGTKFGEKEEISRYLKYKKVFDHEDMSNAEVSVAYRLNSRADNINEVENSPIWVYFPTRDETYLPFLIHGSFETAVSREKLMAPSSFNNDLFDELGDLIAESMMDLAKRNLITQVFLRRIILGAFEDEGKNETISGLKEKITDVIVEKGLLPDRNGIYRKPEEMILPVPFRMAEFADKPLFTQVFTDKIFVAFNNEREAKFSEYYNWLVNELNVPVYGLCELAHDLSVFSDMTVPTSGINYENLKDFYDFLSDNREAVYDTGRLYMRSGPYEQRLRQDLKEAWNILRKAPIILNRLNHLVPAEVDGKSIIYLGASSEYKSVMQSALVSKGIADIYGKLLTEGFHIKEFNNFQFIQEKVIQKYIDIDESLGFIDHDNFEDEYIEDLNQIFALIKETGDVSRIRELLKDAYIIKTKPEPNEEKASFSRPRDCYVPVSDEKIDLELYYAPIMVNGIEEDRDDPNNWYDFDLFAIDKDFYEENGIPISDLSKLGLITSPIYEGRRFHEGIGDNHWVAIGEYCPELTISGLNDNLRYIAEYHADDLAKKKSAEILKMLLGIANKLQGKKKYRKINPYTSELRNTAVLSKVIREYKWLYDNELEVHKSSELSRLDLNKALYSEVSADKTAYAILGFVEKEIDETEEAFQKAFNLNRQDKKILVSKLARELGLQVSEAINDDDWEDDEEDVFDPNTWRDEEFPVNRVNNIDYLIRHVQEQFYCADPITYKSVLRQIRVSKNTKADRSYAIGMYTNSSNTKICQMCRKSIAFIEVDQISNFGIEMPQLNLCLCRECSAKYHAMRDGNKEEFKKQISAALLSIDINEYSDDYSIQFNEDTALHFTQTHIAEIQEILRLLAEYGAPSADDEEENGDGIVGGPLMHPIRTQDVNEAISVDSINDPVSNEIGEGSTELEVVATEGMFISYKKKFANDEIYDNVLQPSKFPLHKALEGHKVGDVVKFQGKEYEIIGILK